MNKSIFYTVAVIAFLVVVVSVATYVNVFGSTLSNSHERWGQFGDYFGGLLNPIFAMLAFLALLWSIMLQAREFRSASKLLSRQVDSSSEQLSILRDARIREDIIHVVKDIDERIGELLTTNVSKPGTHPQLTITHMVAEGQRLKRHGGSSSGYSQFLEVARSSGSVVEASIREIIYLMGNMREFLERYSCFEQGTNSPVILYYADKCYQLLDMLENIGGLESDTRQFFATVSDRHG